MSDTGGQGRLSTMEPNPAFDGSAFAETVETFRRLDDDVIVRVWGGDWCKDCRAVLPDFAAVLEAAGVSDERVHHYPVEKREDGTKVGPLVEAYDVQLIPTIVVERLPEGDPSAAGEELARFVEAESVPAAVHLADQLDEYAEE